MSRGAHSKKRWIGTSRGGAHSVRRQHRLVMDSTARRLGRRSPAILGAVVLLGLGVGGGAAYAYFTTSGLGPGSASVGSPVTITVTGVSGSPDLLPGGTGAVSFTLTNTNAFGATFTTVTPGATVVSQNTGACASSNITIAPTLPYSFSPVVVSAGTTSVTQSIPNLVKLAPSAPTGCQGVKFTVTLTLSGTST